MACATRGCYHGYTRATTI